MALPNYDYQCVECGEEFEAFNSMSECEGQKCVVCEGGCRIVLNRVAAPFVWKPMWYRDICEKPLYIETKQQLKDACKKHGVVAARLL